MPIKVYCDSGGYIKKLKSLEKIGNIEILYYPYENTNKNISNEALPSSMKFSDMIRPWDEKFYPWSDYLGSEKFEELCKILNIKENWKDILHLDSAYKSKCNFFVTSDKKDIFNNKEKISSLLNIEICLVPNIDSIIRMISQ